jgi:undecaprenyl pyrophosphate synthase
MVLKRFLPVVGAYRFYERWLWYQVKNGRKLEHIAIILDGNRRWASENDLNPWLGHKKGAWLHPLDDQGTKEHGGNWSKGDA